MCHNIDNRRVSNYDRWVPAKSQVWYWSAQLESSWHCLLFSTGNFNFLFNPHLLFAFLGLYVCDQSLFMFGWTGRQCEWTMCELQWVGNEEKRASSSVHVQPHWNSLLCNPLCYDPRRVHFHWKVCIHIWAFLNFLTDSITSQSDKVRYDSPTWLEPNTLSRVGVEYNHI